MAQATKLKKKILRDLSIEHEDRVTGQKKKGTRGQLAGKKDGVHRRSVRKKR